MTFDKGDRAKRTTRGMFVCAFALVCAACGSDEQPTHPGGSAGGMNAAGNAGHAAAGAGGEVDAAGASGEGGAVNEGGSSGEGSEVEAGAPGGGNGGTGANGGTGGGDGEPHTGGNSVGGNSSGGSGETGGTSAGGTNSGGTNSGGTNSGGTSVGGTNSGGTDTTGGTSSGGSNVGGTDATGGTSSGGTSFAGTSSGGTGFGGTGSGGAPAAACGDALLQGVEECDDGNTKSWDGCSAECKYEVVDRMTKIALQGGAAPSFCAPTTNALGRSISSIALPLINGQLAVSIANGALNNLVQFSGLEDLTAASDDSSVSVGFLPSVPDSAQGAWPGAPTPVDFWFRAFSSSVNSQGLPMSSLVGSLSARSLSAGPGLLSFPLAFSGAPNTLSVSNARLLATLNADPNVPAPPPANLAPGLTVFQTITGSGAGQGLCGNVTVESLAQIPVPTYLTGSAQTACISCTGSRTYTACSGNTVTPGCNSMLDVLVGGCRVFACSTSVVTATQPDVPGIGGAAVHTLTLGSGNAVSSNQTIGNTDAYSSYFKFDANRAHVTGLQQ